MHRFFLSGPTTCAMLLGAGLLLRAQAALRAPEGSPAAIESPRTRPSQLLAERAPRPPRPTSAPARTEQRSSHTRKGFAHRGSLHRVRRCGFALAGQWLHCGQPHPVSG